MACRPLATLSGLGIVAALSKLFLVDPDDDAKDDDENGGGGGDGMTKLEGGGGNRISSCSPMVCVPM